MNANHTETAQHVSILAAYKDELITRVASMTEVFGESGRVLLATACLIGLISGTACQPGSHGKPTAAVHSKSTAKTTDEPSPSFLEAFGLTAQDPIIFYIGIDSSTSAARNRSEFIKFIEKQLNGIPSGSRIEVMQFDRGITRQGDWTVSGSGGELGAARKKLSEMEDQLKRNYKANPCYPGGTNVVGGLKDITLFVTGAKREANPKTKIIVCLWSDLISDCSKFSDGTVTTYPQIDGYSWPTSFKNVNLALMGVDPSKQQVVLTRWASQVRALKVYSAEHTIVPSDLYLQSSNAM